MEYSQLRKKKNKRQKRKELPRIKFRRARFIGGFLISCFGLLKLALSSKITAENAPSDEGFKVAAMIKSSPETPAIAIYGSNSIHSISKDNSESKTLTLTASDKKTAFQQLDSVVYLSDSLSLFLKLNPAGISRYILSKPDPEDSTKLVELSDYSASVVVNYTSNTHNSYNMAVEKINSNGDTLVACLSVESTSSTSQQPNRGSWTLVQQPASLRTGARRRMEYSSEKATGCL